MAEDFFRQFGEMTNDIPKQGESERAERDYYAGTPSALDGMSV
jgi:hypothetical protein